MLRLHDYWRSSAAYRVRIALNLKGLVYQAVPHDLRQGQHRQADYTSLNPQGLVPTLEDDGHILTQSSAIVEWLEERYPQPPLLPSTPNGRAHVRAMYGLIGSDIHPLNNLRVLSQLRGPMQASEDQIGHWMSHWIVEGFRALEAMVADHGQGFCYGSTPTLADCYLIPQVFSAQRFGIDISAYPLLRAINTRCDEIPAFVRAHPRHQADAETVNETQ